MYWFRWKCAEGWAIVFPERLKLAEVRTSLWDLLCDMVTDINTEAWSLTNGGMTSRLNAEISKS